MSTEYHKRSNENFKNQQRMIEEMQSAGLEVVRSDTGYGCGCELLIPAKVVMRGHDATYYPNAVRDMYDKWVNEGRPDGKDG